MLKKCSYLEVDKDFVFDILNPHHFSYKLFQKAIGLTLENHFYE